MHFDPACKACFVTRKMGRKVRHIAADIRVHAGLRLCIKCRLDIFDHCNSAADEFGSWREGCGELAIVLVQTVTP